MRGELWQPCEVCDTEPACAWCFNCERHCDCPPPPIKEELERRRVEEQRTEQERARKGEAYRAFVEEQTKGLVYTTALPSKVDWRPLKRFDKDVPGTWYTTGATWSEGEIDGQRVLRHDYGNAVAFYAPQEVVDRAVLSRWDAMVQEDGEQIAALTVLAYTVNDDWKRTLGSDVYVRLVELKGREYFLDLARSQPWLIGNMRNHTPYSHLIEQSEIPVVMLTPVATTFAQRDALKLPSGDRVNAVWIHPETGQYYAEGYGAWDLCPINP